MDEATETSTKALAVFTIVEGRAGQPDAWRRIGSGFRNRDGSFNLFLDALPISGKLHVRENSGTSLLKET